MNPKLYEVDLVDGKQKVCRPKRPRDAAQMAGNDVISGGCSRGQPRRSHHLGRGSRSPRNPPDKRLKQKCTCGRAAYPQQSAILPSPKQNNQTRSRNDCQNQNRRSDQLNLVGCPCPDRPNPGPTLDGRAQPKQREGNQDERHKPAATSAGKKTRASSRKQWNEEYPPRAMFARNNKRPISETSVRFGCVHLLTLFMSFSYCSRSFISEAIEVAGIQRSRRALLPGSPARHSRPPPLHAA